MKFTKSFDCGYEVKGVFLDISKGLDKVWHDHHAKRCEMLSKYQEKWNDGIIFNLERHIWKITQPFT